MRRNDIRQVSIMNFDGPTKWELVWENISSYKHYIRALGYSFIGKLRISQTSYRKIYVPLIIQFKNKTTIDRLIMLKYKHK